MRALAEAGCPFLRLDWSDLAGAEVTLDPSAGRWLFRRGDATVDLGAVRSAYLRRPTLELAADQVPPGYSAFRRAEWLATTEAVENLLGERWLNGPWSGRRAEDKLLQLRLAREVGFDMPDTIVTNDPAEARRFATKGRTVMKPIRRGALEIDGCERLIFARRVEPEELDDAAVRTTPLILQRLVDGVDLRVVVVDEACFAARILRDGSSEEVDWRRDPADGVGYEVHDLPREMAARCARLVGSLGLRFAALDLIIDRDGVHWFLEANPTGQWAWLERRLGLGISKALAGALAA